MAVSALPLIGLTASVQAQITAPLAQQHVVMSVDSGAVRNAADRRQVIWSTLVHVDQAPWLRLEFGIANLGDPPPGGEPTILRITSLHDGYYQTMNATHLWQWEFTSAYFNGDTVRVEIIADPKAGPSHVTVGGAWAGLPAPPEPETICGTTDDRVLSSESANARLLPSGCTAWIISDSNHCFLTAGHCGTSGTSVIQFNVPLSNANGSLNNPPPQHQYTPDAASIRFTNGGIGNDYCYFGCFPNSTTGLTPFQAQNAFYQLAAAAPAPAGQQIRITGYGTVSSPVSLTWNQVQKTHTGPYTAQPGTTVQYQVDTTGGNSGSPVVNLANNTAIGIHTHGGCSSTGGANSGTAIQLAVLQAALAAPLGVCIPAPPANNTCPNATLVGVGSFSFNTQYATTDGPDEPGLCNFGGYTNIANDVWFKYLAQCTGSATISLCGANFNSKMAVYANGCPTGSGQAIACNDSFCGDDAQVTINVVSGQMYHVRVGGGANGASGSGTMSITCALLPSCPADITLDGQVNINDLLAVINAWGPCPAPPASCPADITADGQININDLLVVINAWGPCP